MIMRKTFILLIVVVFVGCAEKPAADAEEPEARLLPFMDQLFLFQESTDPVSCGSEGAITVEPARTGVLRITRKGHAIHAVIDQQGDTMRYRWGTYTISNRAITYRLTDEYYFAGHWDDPWNVPDPTYAEGLVRSIDEPEMTLTRTDCDPTFYYVRYTERERSVAAQHYATASPQGLSFRPYHEPADMKFYTWLFKQIPVLADL